MPSKGPFSLMNFRRNSKDVSCRRYTISCGCPRTVCSQQRCIWYIQVRYPVEPSVGSAHLFLVKHGVPPLVKSREHGSEPLGYALQRMAVALVGRVNIHKVLHRECETDHQAGGFRGCGCTWVGGRWTWQNVATFALEWQSSANPCFEEFVSMRVGRSSIGLDTCELSDTHRVLLQVLFEAALPERRVQDFPARAETV
eukprot:1188603-Prorocentrum_minimum.AAC.2